MKNVIMYTKPTCPYCKKAILILNKNKITPMLINISQQPTKRAEMVRKTNRTTVPQIFIDGNHIGGCDDLIKLEKTNQLAVLLGN